MGSTSYILAAVLLLAAILLSRRPRGSSIRARDTSGVVIGGDVNSGVIVTGDNNRVVTRSRPGTAPPKQRPDWVVRVIGFAGVLIAAAQLAVDLWHK
jgi:hypothetical protein